MVVCGAIVQMPLFYGAADCFPAAFFLVHVVPLPPLARVAVDLFFPPLAHVAMDSFSHLGACCISIFTDPSTFFGRTRFQAQIAFDYLFKDLKEKQVFIKIAVYYGAN